MLKLNQLVVHRLIKDEGTLASVELSTNLLPIDDRANELIQRLDLSYKKTQHKDYAIFKKNIDYLFPLEFERYNKSQVSFLKFSQNTTDQLRKDIKSIYQAKGGYLVFADYENDVKNFVSIFLIRDTVGLLFRKDDKTKTFLIDPIQHLDLAKLAMACRINVARYKNDEGQYLSFIKKRQSDISDYFIEWIAATERINNNVYTNEFYELTKKVKLPNDENGNQLGREDLRKRIYDFVNSSPNKTVNLRTISEMFFPLEEFGEDYLLNLAEEKDLTISPEFSADMRVFKKFIRVNLQADGLVVRFSRGEYGKKISLHPENPNIIIINSERLADQFRQETSEWNH